MMIEPNRRRMVDFLPDWEGCPTRYVVGFGKQRVRDLA